MLSRLPAAPLAPANPLWSPPDEAVPPAVLLPLPQLTPTPHAAATMPSEVSQPIARAPARKQLWAGYGSTPNICHGGWRFRTGAGLLVPKIL